MTKLQIVGLLRMAADYHRFRAAQRADGKNAASEEVHQAYQQAIEKAADYIEGRGGTPDFLSQALNEGDGTYRP